MKIAIIGSGFFGIACAIKLSETNTVDLYEAQADILQQASKKNQFRFHLGYHYPRSDRTVNEIKKSNVLFKNFYRNLNFKKTKNFYAIAKKKTKTSLNKFLDFTRKHNLPLQRINNTKNIYRSDFYLSKETNLNYFHFKNYVKNIIKKNKKIKTYYKKKFNRSLLNLYDKIIVCCYSNNNKVLKSLGINKLKKLKYELIEKIVIKLPKKFINKSYVILDGKFVCVDPYLGTKYHLLSDVKYSKLEVVKSFFPNFKSKYKKYLNSGLVKIKNNKNFLNFINHSKNYLPFLKDASYIGSFFVVRALSLNKNSVINDERLNNLTRHGKILAVLSGKWNTSVWMAKKVNELIKL